LIDLQLLILLVMSVFYERKVNSCGVLSLAIWLFLYRVFFVLGCMQVMASKTKIYFVLEYVTGGELFNQIVSIIISLS
jgi:hypothetical protein